MNTNLKCIGDVELLIEWKDGKKETQCFKNTVLQKGRMALASSLANDYGDSYDYYISRMVFGDGGTNESGVPLYVNADRNGLFSSILSKPISVVIDPTFPYQAVFTSVITYEDANGETINEMGLQMNNGDLYSMVTMGNITKTSAAQLVWSWRVSFI